MKLIAIFLALYATFSLGTAQGGARAIENIKLINDVKQCIHSNEGNASAAVKCFVDVLGSDFIGAMEKVKTLLKSKDQEVNYFLSSKKQEIHQYLILNGGLVGAAHDKVHELRLEGKDWLENHFGKRQKRGLIPDSIKPSNIIPNSIIPTNILPSFDNVALVSKVKACLNNDTDERSAFECLDKALGLGILEAKSQVDALLKGGTERVESIVNSGKEKIESVLREATEKAESLVTNANQKFESMLQGAGHKVDTFLRTADDKVINYLHTNGKRIISQWLMDKTGVSTVVDKYHDVKNDTMTWFGEHFG